jgi:hypothetical protein
MDGLLYVYLKVNVDARLPQHSTATVFVDLYTADGTAIHSRDYALVSPLRGTVPFKAGTHKMSRPIILLVPGGGSSRTFTLTLGATYTYAEGSEKNKTYTARIGGSRTMGVTITDNSQGMTTAASAASVSFTCMISQVSELTFLNELYTYYQLGVGSACGLPYISVVVTGVVGVGDSVAVKTSLYTTAEDSTDRLTNVSTRQFVKTASDIMTQYAGRLVSLSISTPDVHLNCHDGIGAEWVTQAGCRCKQNFYGSGSQLKCQPCPLVDGVIQSFSEPGSSQCMVSFCVCLFGSAI